MPVTTICNLKFLVHHGYPHVNDHFFFFFGFRSTIEFKLFIWWACSNLDLVGSGYQIMKIWVPCARGSNSFFINTLVTELLAYVWQHRGIVKEGGYFWRPWYLEIHGRKIQIFDCNLLVLATWLRFSVPKILRSEGWGWGSPLIPHFLKILIGNLRFRYYVTKCGTWLSSEDNEWFFSWGYETWPLSGSFVIATCIKWILPSIWIAVAQIHISAFIYVTLFSLVHEQDSSFYQNKNKNKISSCMHIHTCICPHICQVFHLYLSTCKYPTFTWSTSHLCMWAYWHNPHWIWVNPNLPDPNETITNLSQIENIRPSHNLSWVELGCIRYHDILWFIYNNIPLLLHWICLMC